MGEPRVGELLGSHPRVRQQLRRRRTPRRLHVEGAPDQVLKKMMIMMNDDDDRLEVRVPSKFKDGTEN